MAEKRMFAKTIIDSDAFIDMPVSTRLLYVTPHAGVWIETEEKLDKAGEYTGTFYNYGGNTYEI